jgi:MFS family permease
VDRRPARRVSRTVILLGAIALASMLCEGASADWAAVYLRGSLYAGAAIAGLGYTAFSLAMVATRLFGNRLLGRFRAARLLPVLAAVATVGFTAGLLGGRVVTAIVGFGCLGAGLALVIPSVFSAAGRLPGLDPGAAIATVSAFGWAGFVCGPPVIGEIASATSLPVALGLIPALTAVIAVATALTAALKPAGPAARP